MAPSESDPNPSLQQERRDVVSELKANGRWGAVITTLCFMYGQMTVASTLPADPRQDSWVLMKSPLPTLALSFTYLAFVTWWGPLYMASRKPITGTRNLMIAYNAFQVVYSGWLFIESGRNGWFGDYKFICQTCDFSDHPQAIGMMHVGFWYYFSKLIDFMDTIFFVLNKKYEHISVLHVSHHALMPIGVWYGVRYQPGGHATLMGFINSFVHTVMYSYYLLAAMGPRVRPFLWWKKYLTTLQMVQFTIVFFHAMSLAFVECEVPPVLLRWVSGLAVMFFVLFANFYIKAYRKRGKTNQGQGQGKGGMPDIPKICYMNPATEMAREIGNGVAKRSSNSVSNEGPMRLRGGAGQ